MSTPTKPETQRYQATCPQCGAEFTSRDSLRLHLAKNHDVGTIYTCSGCQAQFTDQSAYNDHVEICTRTS